MKSPFAVYFLIFHLTIYPTLSFNKGEEIIIYVNKVGPYFNPHETYHYYELPVCRPKIIEQKALTLGEVLDGDRMAKSLYKINFLENVSEQSLCDLTLSSEEIDYLKLAVEENYYFEFVVDDIPVRDFIGHLEETGFVPHTHQLLLWTHNHFHFYYNQDKIIFVNTTKDHLPISLDDMQPPYKYSPTYSVSWIETKTDYKNRGILLHDTKFFPVTLEIHWLSVINSSVLVLLLTGFVVVILTRVLKNDFARYDKSFLDAESDDEYGWKIIHTDVFRIPPHINLFSAILGVGTQFLAITCGIIAMALFGLFNVHRHGAVNSAAVFLYAFTCVISGFVSGNFYRKLGGRKWVSNINLTTILFAGPFFLIWSIQNTVAWIYQSTQALPFFTTLLLLMVWIFVGYPLTILGGIIGKRNKAEFNFPCRTKNIRREIPEVPWYKKSKVQWIIGGFLPFSAISVEMYYIFSTLWGREQYTLYGILGLVFGMLLSVTACVSVTLTYFQLSSEDYRWWWRSIINAGSSSLFVLIYCMFYYMWRTNMSGVLQSTEFFGWSLLTAYVFFLSLGTVSFFSSFEFVRYIYTSIKID